MTSKPRLNRMFGADGSCFDVAIDHGFFNEPSMLSGIENMSQAVGTVAGAVPVLVRGGGRVPDEEILHRTEALMQQGANGIVYGRNVIQHQRPAAITRTLMAIVHKGKTAQQPMSELA